MAVSPPRTSIALRLAKPDPEHDQHQRPAAPDAERAVGDPHAERLGTDGRATPAIDDEAERAPAFLEAAVAQRAELPQAGDREGRRDDQLGMFGEPGEGIDGGMDAAIRQPRAEPERAPHEQVSGQQEHDQLARPLAPSNERPEGEHQRDARGQHHRHDHQHPAEREERGLEDQRCRRPGMVEVRPVARPFPHPQSEPGGQGETDEGAAEDRPVATWEPQVRRREHRVPAEPVRPRSGSGPAGRCGPGGRRSGSRARCRHACTGSPCWHRRANPGSC